MSFQNYNMHYAEHVFFISFLRMCKGRIDFVLRIFGALARIVNAKEIKVHCVYASAYVNVKLHLTQAFSSF